jgi:pregnancy-associated plasma protein-A/type IX secretion system substrate protein/CARDB protein
LKKFTFLAITAIVLFSSCPSLFAQQRTTPNSINTQFDRCGTMQALENAFQINPDARIQHQNSQAALERRFREKVAELANNNNLRTQATTTIPVVVHIVLPNASNVTDAAVLDQINILNVNYSGLNPDSTNASLFYPVRGHSEIRFCIAQRTPADLPTTGIERRNSATTFTVGSGDPIKYTSMGGLDAWDPNKYLNIWVGIPTNSSILGYATLPGLGLPLIEHGAAINFRAFSSINPTGSTLIPSYNNGRTTVHEIGHFFNLVHIWGDASGCGTDDGVADTPLQDDETFGCPGGVQTDACSPSSPGYMYQNYMDYTDDACMTMFTSLQAIRMQSSLSDPTRVGLVTSNGCIPPVLVANDAEIQSIVTPINNFATCDPTTPLTVTLRNFGTNNLTSATITVQVDAVTVQTYNWTGNLASLASTNINLNAITLALGANTLTVCTSSPNGVADGNPTNDCKTSIVTRGGGYSLPLVEGFEGAGFPPAGWLRVNPDGGITWERTTIGAGHTGTAKAFVYHSLYFNTGQLDDLRTPSLTIGTADSLSLEFWVAYRGFPGFPSDQLQLRVSTDCGASFQVIKTFDNLSEIANGQTQVADYFPSSPNQYVKKSFDLSSLIPSGNVIVNFRTINNWGNNVHIDDINIKKINFKSNDAGVIAINRPNTRECITSGAPVVVIQNFGKIALTSVMINYQIDGGAVNTTAWTGNLPRLGTATVTLPVANFGALGSHSITAYTTLPNNVADEDPSNDGLTKAFETFPVVPLTGNLVEGFNSSTFPPPGWTVFNPDGDMTWDWTGSVGKNAPGAAWFNDWNNATNNRIDDLMMPNFSYSGFDSIFLSFQLSTVTYSYPGTTGILIDTLSVLLSKDCGNTFTTIYKKWGEDLQTVNDPNFPKTTEFFPLYDYHWRLDSLNLGRWLGNSETQFQVVYRFHGNFENNLFLDDINLKTQVVPAKLKTQGYLVLPNPFTTTFGIWHYQTPANLKYINVYNSVGQLVWSKQYSGNGQRFIQVDLSKNAAGVYNVTLGYEDSNRNVVIPVLKL